MQNSNHVKYKPFEPIDLLINKTKILTVKVFKDLGIYLWKFKME